MKAKIIASAPRFYVENVEECLSFYINKLGFNLIDKVPHLYGMVQRDGFQIHFSKATQQFAKHTNHILIWIPEIDLFWNEIQKANITILEPIVLKPYGNREFVIQDIAGNIITICD